MFRPFLKKADPEPVVTEGQRVYAIGDVHGRLDLLDQLLEMIRIDNESRLASDVTVILLGDLIDRGPESAGVVTRAMQPLDWARLICLKGNHEVAMEGALDGDLVLADLWLRVGGTAALRSWGVSEMLLESGKAEEIVAEAQRLIPRDVRDWIAERPISCQIGDYYFVHAGVRPGVPLDRQTAEDCLWIRDPFLQSRKWHDAMIVHGHSIIDGVEERRNRIGIDTGAFASGRLTAMGAETADRWFLQASVSAGLCVAD